MADPLQDAMDLLPLEEAGNLYQYVEQLKAKKTQHIIEGKELDCEEYEAMVASAFANLRSTQG
jgi:hypothetical protein